MEDNSIVEPENKARIQTVYSACVIWHVAANAAQRATDAKAANEISITSDTLGAVILAAAAAEGFINELSHRLLAQEERDWGSLPTSPVDWKNVAMTLQNLEAAHKSANVKALARCAS